MAKKHNVLYYCRSQSQLKVAHMENKSCLLMMMWLAAYHKFFMEKVGFHECYDIAHCYDTLHTIDRNISQHL